MIKDIMNANDSATPNSREMAVLKENFPSCFKADGSFDIERFKEFLSDKIAVTGEGYELKFLGKNYARLLASIDTTTVVVPDEEHNSKPENMNSENIYISGDNLDGLKHLLKSYSRQVKCIYIDPPYNTGTDGFVYNDQFNFTVEELSEKLSISEEQAQRILDLTKRGSASHSAWLMFMYPRLLLARDLLKDNGVIYISIDDNECHNLKLLCDDVFGEENFVGNFVINSTPNARDYGHIGKMHEYCLFYVKNNEETETNMLPDTDKNFKYIDDKGGFNIHPLYNSNEAFHKGNRPNLFYPFYLYLDEPCEDGFFKIGLEERDNSIEIYPPKSLRNNVQFVWRWGKEKARRYMNQEIIGYRTNSDEYRIVQKMRHNEKLIRSILSDTKYSSRRGTAEVEELLGGKIFSFPKPLSLISDLIKVGMNEDDIIVDFFSGSATTAHSVMQLNAEDSGRRKFIMVQIPEPVLPNSDAEKAGYKTIDEIGMERIRRAATEIKEDYPDTTADLGFKHYTLVEPEQNTLDKLEKFDPTENKLFADKDILSDFGKPTVLATWLVRDGYGLTADAEELNFAGYNGYYIGKHLYLIDPELSNKAIEAIVVKYETDGSFNPENVVLFGYSFTWTEMEALKINLKRLKDTEKNLRINFDIRY
ncbi:site-specific DNA-methyltransferase [Weizmannia coagulans]|jgi:adenine-specific DNA-methyltransferase|nr:MULTISPECIES: site-specific DNA-methyltransferase [Heyndrickxia]KXT21158.1 restriction endonuclease subunit M [Heyndrickxia coagulans]MBT2195807.1 site-specific DNA-methyltransferase [Heyndrickxia coagulans]MBT2237982.1 site-specific DNA-methyltransferase [Heyndrickxia coagulans]MCR4446094.1 site-specific DNA-methyltransferase [Heyndrickxia coagulans]MCU6438824.1 site-specific DNA-methyltransferase [Heyndrickxia coagulans]